MPFQSESQRRFMYANHPKMAEKWESHTPNKKLPEKVAKCESVEDIVRGNIDQIIRGNVDREIEKARKGWGNDWSKDWGNDWLNDWEDKKETNEPPQPKPAPTIENDPVKYDKENQLDLFTSVPKK